MGIALGGLGVVSLRIPLAWSKSIFHVLDLPTILLSIFLVAILGLIAYFTNPSEASFRKFLTELAFRQHLSRLSEAQNIDPDDYDEGNGTCYDATPSVDDTRTLKTSKSSNHSVNLSENIPVVFHFANKASVSFRTPSYDFRSFAVLTFAVVSPVEMALIPTIPPASAHSHQSKTISWSNPDARGSWFVGAFGRWWVGLEISIPLRQHVRISTHDESALREKKISGRTRIDDTDPNSIRQEELTTNKAGKPSASRRAFTAAPHRSKAALRERLSLQTQLASHKRDAAAAPNIPSRPTTPPPLPKSASLPLHAKRIPGQPPSPEARKVKNSSSTQSYPLLPTSAVPTSQSPPVQDHSPIIADLLQQLDAARNANSDLQAQLNNVHATSAATTAALGEEVAAARATKKSEDAGRAAIKAQTKVLDDRRRQADGMKRDVEKRYKAAVTQRDGTTSRIERLGKEVEEMQKEMEANVLHVEEEHAKIEEERLVVTNELAVKREELKVAEDEVHMLSARARELESAIAEESARMANLKAQRAKPKTSLWPPPLSARTSPHTGVGPLPSPGHLLIKPSHSDGSGAHSHFRPFADSPVSPGPLSPVSASLIPSSLMHSMDIPPQASVDSYFPASPLVHSPVDVSTNFARYEDECQRKIRFDEGLEFRPDPLIQRPRSPSPVLPLSKHRRWFSGKERGLNPDAKEFTLPSRSAMSADQIPTLVDILHPHSAQADTFPTSTADIFHSNTPGSGYRTTPESSPQPRFTLAGSLFSSLQDAFAPSPAEREALQRALGSGSMNSSREVVGGGGIIASGLERASQHSAECSGGGSHNHNASPHWGAAIGPIQTQRHRSIFNPWDGDGQRQ